MKKFLCSLLVAILLFTLSIPAMAAETVQPSIEIYKYNENTKQYDIPAETAQKGELLLVKVAFNQEVKSLASLRLKLQFSSKLVSYIEGSFTPELVQGNYKAGAPVHTVKSNYVIAFWGNEGVSEDYQVAITDSATKIASYLFCCEASDGIASFKASIDNAYDVDGKSIAATTKTSSAVVELRAWELSAENLAIFEKLAEENIQYTVETVANIQKADGVYQSLTATEKANFKSSYPELYEDYRVAWTRYYDKATNAQKTEVLAEIQNFYENNKEVLELAGAEAVNDGNYEAVLQAIKAYDALSSRAKTMTEARSYKAKLDSLEEAAIKIRDRIWADSDADVLFVDAYSDSLWNLEVSDLNKENYQDVEVLVAEAQASYKDVDYDNLSSAKKQEVDALNEKLTSFSDAIAKIAEEVGEDASVQKEIQAFMDKWHVVTKLTALTVGVDDKTAIELMLEDYEKLSPIVQERLLSRKNTAEQLLQMIASLESSGATTVPSGGSTQEIVKEVTKEVIKEVPKETLVTETLQNTMFRNVPTIVYIAILVMGLAVFSMMIPLAIYVIHRWKKNKKGEEGV